MRPGDPNQAPSETRRALTLAGPGVLVLLGLAALSLVLVARHRTVGAQASSSAPLSAVDARGRLVALARPPVRIVSLTPANTEILFALGLKGRIVADTSYCDTPQEAKSLPHVGDATISAEKVVAQRPDLVVASASANAKVLPALERTGIPVFAVDPTSLPDVVRAIGTIGAITGRQREARFLVGGILRHMAEVRAQVARSRSRPRVLVVLQADPLWVAGSGTFVDELVGLAGGTNITHDSGAGFHTFSPERVIALRPDVILAASADVQRILTRPGWRALPAVQHHAVYSPDPNLMNRPGPRLPDGLAVLARLLHPDLVWGR